MASNITSVQNKFKINNSQFLRLRTMNDVNYEELASNQEALQQLDTFDQNLVTAGNINELLKVLGKFIGVNICRDIVIGQNESFNYAIPTVTSLINYLTEYGDGEELQQSLAAKTIIFIKEPDQSSDYITKVGDWEYYGPKSITFNKDVTPNIPQSVAVNYINTSYPLKIGDFVYINIFARKLNSQNAVVDYKFTEGLYKVKSVSGSTCYLGKCVPVNKNTMYFGYLSNGNRNICIPNRNVKSSDIKTLENWRAYSPFTKYSLTQSN